MPNMRSPYVAKPVAVPDELVDRFRANGFEVVDVTPVAPVEGEPKRSSRKRGK